MADLKDFYLPKGPAVFIGRKKALENFEKVFFHYNVMVIDGIEGIGKTSFALNFAGSLDKNKLFLDFAGRLCWIQCEEGWTITTLLNRFNLFISNFGEHEFEIYLKNNEINLEDTVKTLVSILDKLNYIIFIDDYNRIIPSESLIFLRTISKFLRKSRIILITSQKPSLNPVEWLEIYELNLNYLKKKDTFQMINTITELYSVPSVSEKDLEKIYKKFGGYPLFIKSFLGILLSSDKTIEELTGEISSFNKLSENYLPEKLLNGLTKTERRLLISLSVYRRPVKRGAIDLIYSEDNLEEIINNLKEKFLLDLDREKRYSIPAIIKDFCYGKSEQKSLHRLCAGYYKDLWLNDSSEKLENGKEAFYHFIRSKDYYEAYNILLNIMRPMFYSFQLNELENSIDLILDITHEVHPHFFIYKGEILRLRGKVRDAIKLLEEKLPDFQERERNHLLFLLARFYARIWNLDKSLELIESSINISYKINDRAFIIKGLSHKGSVYRLQGDFIKALDYYGKCKEINKDFRDDLIELTLDQSIAITLAGHGKFRESLILTEECLSRAKDIKFLPVKLSLLNNLAFIHYELAEYEKASKIWEDNKNYCKEFGWKEPLLNALLGSSALFEETGEPDLAYSQYLETLKLSEEIENPYFNAFILNRLAYLAICRGEIKEADDFCNKGLQISELYGFSILKYDIKFHKVLIFFLKGENDKIYPLLNEIFESGKEFQKFLTCRFKYINEGEIKYRDEAEKKFSLFYGSKKRRAESYMAVMDDFAAKLSPCRSKREYIVKMKDRVYDATLEEIEKLKKRQHEFDIFIDTLSGTVTEKDRGKINIFKKKTLAELLFFLVKNGGDFFSPCEIFSEIWKGRYVHDTDAPVVKMSISRLRNIIEPCPKDPKYLLLSPIRYKRERKYYFNDDTDFCYIGKRDSEG